MSNKVDVDVKVKVDDNELDKTIEKVEEATERAKELQDILEVLGVIEKPTNWKINLDGEAICKAVKQVQKEDNYKKTGSASGGYSIS